MTLTHEICMQRCIDLARNGLGLVAPNPMVGAVIVHNQRIIGEGFHTGFGMPHAEVEAVNQVMDQSLLPDSTLYVNLEPCSHHGKTPPCTSLILEKGIRKVVIGQSDPNPAAGGGINLMRSQGVEVITGVLEKESHWLNRRFNTFHELKRPWLIFKWAQTTDGYVDAIRRSPDNRTSIWITDETCRRLVHKWRSEEQAILAGSRTIQSDDPQLNVRSWSGKNPLRITIDRSGRLAAVNRQSPLRIMNGEIPTVVYTFKEQESLPNLDFIRISPDQPVWRQVFDDLHNRHIQSVLIEGGPTLLESLIREGLWDEARIFIGPGWFGEGVKAPDFPFEPQEHGEVGNSRLLNFYREESNR
jgi:diaminohydroxyphosphoribosylaminopyrimidine deaminase/5-amino-6-(5-phosphoribosylamino)uracil reductase